MTNASAPRSRIYYGWYVIAASFLTIFFTLSLRNSFGIYFKAIIAEYGWSRAQLSLPVAVSLILFGAFQPVAGLLVVRFGARAVMTVCSLLMGIALLGMSQIDSLLGIYIFYGILLAIGGAGTSFTPITSLLANWFQERRGTAYSIASAGASIGQLVGIPLLVLLLAWAGWRGSFLWTGTVTLALLIPICLFIVRNRPEDVGLAPEAEKGDGGGNRIRRRVPYNLPWVRCLVKAPFLLLVGSFFTCGFTVTIMSVHWIPFATDVGFSTAVAATAFALGGGLNTVGTLVVGPLSDRMGRKIPLSFIYLLRGLAFLLFIPLKNDFTVWLVPMMIGLSWIATVPLTSALTGDFFGAKNVGVLFGLVTLSHQLGSGLSAWLSGYIFDLTGSYDIAFALGGYLCFQAALLVYLIKEGETQIPPVEPLPA